MRARVPALLLLLACVLLPASVVIAYDNPTVDVQAVDADGTGPAGSKGCSIAPWDAALNGNDDPPGGEHTAAYSREMAQKCFEANTARFRTAVGTGLLGAVAALVGAGLALRRGPGRGHDADRATSSPTTAAAG